MNAASTTSETFHFTSAGVRCAATHVAPAGATGASEGPGGRRALRPVVVLAHGLAGTQDAGMMPFAEGFAAAGLHAVTFDYRGFGASEGSPRQSVSLAGQIADLHAVIEAAKRRDGVDPEQVVLWGISLGGGHVVSVAAERDDVAAVISAVPLVDGLAAAALAAREHTPAQLLASTGRGVLSAVRRRAGRGPAMIPVVARPGEVGALTQPGALEDYLAIAGPTWRNEVAADVVMELGTRAPAKAAHSLRVPWLVQVADFDRSAPPHAAMKAAGAGRAEVRHYPGGHFDLFAGKPCHERALAHAVLFLRRHLDVPAPVEPGEPAEVREVAEVAEGSGPAGATGPEQVGYATR
ncbi:alpha/beta fold hydrolase [Nocardioides sp. zg-ZUI104]|uniref:alpha/beta hydrolase n=1 Tax=Nocardioides faecalis TaxID=2803858 RepID=UPI001BCFD3FB|nr:alpha/beta fold hydrolase [Nocardioides faecalis]MBS4751642.1 alpha/beta fold hydrolase [Nocardioides faecalis]